MKKREFVSLLKKFMLIFIGSTVASFLTMALVQYFMGGVRDIQQVIEKSLMIGIGMGLIVFIAPQKRNHYPWL
jgi:magnesium-transporting ATPase (P-type)